MCSRKKVIKLLELKTEDTIVAHANLFTSGKTERLRLSLLPKLIFLLIWHGELI